MRKRINFDILKRNQQIVQKLNNPFQRMLYQSSYQLIDDLLKDIKRPFTNICIHGYYPSFMIQNIINHRKQLQNRSLIPKQSPSINITCIDYLNLLQDSSYSNNLKNLSFDNSKINILNVQNNDAFPHGQQEYDLVISGLELNHTNNEQNLLEKYLRCLKPDGALLGCAMVEGTLSELHWSYLMAENERYGGLSPKIFGFPSLGQLGSFLTSAHYHLTTVLNRDFLLEFDTPLDVLKAIQLVGQSNHLRGRRKAVYKELLLSMYALYQSEFNFESSEEKCRKVLSTLVLAPYLGWKYSQNQPKPLRRGHKGESIDFVDELRKHDPDLQHFRISQDSQDIIEITSEDQKNKTKD